MGERLLDSLPCSCDLSEIVMYVTSYTSDLICIVKVIYIQQLLDNHVHELVRTVAPVVFFLYTNGPVFLSTLQEGD